MDSIEKMRVVIDCEQAIHRFYAALDRSDLPAVSAAISPQGVWHRQGRALQGPAQVSQALAERPAGRTTAHLVQNLVVDVASPTSAAATYMTLVYRYDALEPAAAAVPLGAPLSISLNHDRLERDSQGNWLALEKRSAQKFATAN